MSKICLFLMESDMQSSVINKIYFFRFSDDFRFIEKMFGYIVVTIYKKYLKNR